MKYILKVPVKITSLYDVDIDRIIKDLEVLFTLPMGATIVQQDGEVEVINDDQG